MTAVAERRSFRDLPVVRLISTDGAQAGVTLYGAQHISWIPVGAEERLYLGERSFFNAEAAIGGDIQVIFPQFGNEGPLPHPRFECTSEWVCIEARTGQELATTTFFNSGIRISPAAFG